MKILDCHKLGSMTALFLDEKLPMTNWHSLHIDGKHYEPHMVMDAGKNVIAIDGVYDLTGKTVECV
ncbi:MAG: hypothetical protein ACLR3M_02420 [Collinsella sp.]